MARLYNGAFSGFFSNPRVRTILSNADDLRYLSDSGLPIGSSWVDYLFENCPFPLEPTNHFEIHAFRQITFKDTVEYYSQTPWLAWAEALDTVCLGPWSGFKPATTLRLVEALQQRVAHLPGSLVHEDEIPGRKVVLPMFSRGFQGIVAGVFTNVPKEQRERILTTLMQFGETISDVYADLRWTHFINALGVDLSEDELAREVINAISPVAKIVVTLNGRKAGYRICVENNYWCGYEGLGAAEMSALLSTNSFSVSSPNGAEIYVEPLTDVPHINPYFMRVRLENYLNIAFSTAAVTPAGEPLSRKDVQQLLAEYVSYTDGPAASLAKLRESYVVTKVAKHWDTGQVRITNHEVRRFFEERGRDAKNGYQVTSFAPDLEKIFAGKVTVTKTRDALSLTWLARE
jgi:hypothetical protein